MLEFGRTLTRYTRHSKSLEQSAKSHITAYSVRPKPKDRARPDDRGAPEGEGLAAIGERRSRVCTGDRRLTQDETNGR